MNAQHTTPFLREKLSTSSLFLTYRQAFEKATGCRLALHEQPPSDALSVPVPVGETEPIFLVAAGVDSVAVLQIRGLLRSFALQLGEEANRAVLESHGEQPSTVKAATEYIGRHLGEKIHLDEVAEAVGVCSFQLCRLFKAHTGVTMTEFISRQRVERAKGGLEDPSRQISSVAYESGFSSLSQFNRNFLKYAGEAPSQYRTRLGELEHCELAAV